MWKALTTDQVSEAAQTFDADRRYLSATQKLLDTRHPAVRTLTRIKNEAVGYWRLSTLPYTEDGVRLLPRGRLQVFGEQMEFHKVNFFGAVGDLDFCFAELREEARDRLGRLFEPAYYPASIKEHFGMEWSFPNLEPPDYLKELAPAVYEQEVAKVQAKFTEAVSLAEQAFTEQFAQLVSHIIEKLSPGQDGKKKVFRDSSIENLKTFFDSFSQLNVTGCEDLEKLVIQAKELVADVTPGELRNYQHLRNLVSSGLAQVEAALAPLIIARPRRKIVPIKKLQETS